MLNAFNFFFINLYQHKGAGLWQWSGRGGMPSAAVSRRVEAKLISAMFVAGGAVLMKHSFSSSITIMLPASLLTEPRSLLEISHISLLSSVLESPVSSASTQDVLLDFLLAQRRKYLFLFLAQVCSSPICCSTCFRILLNSFHFLMFVSTVS